LLRFVPEPVKRPINNAWEAFKKKVMNLYLKKSMFEESKKSALKGFATQNTIKAPKKHNL